MRSVGIRAYFEVEMTGLMRDWIWRMREEFKNQNRTFPCNLFTKLLLSLRKSTPSYIQSQNKNLGLRFIGFFPRVIIKFHSSFCDMWGLAWNYRVYTSSYLIKKLRLEMEPNANFRNSNEIC